MPAMTNPDDYYQSLINQDGRSTAIKGSNGLMYCPECGDACKLFEMKERHWHCVECGEIR